MLPPCAHLALFQPRVGIGDMVWHLPHIRALARHAGGRVTLVARPRSAADQLLGPEDGITDIFCVERDQWTTHGRHQGLVGTVRLVADLRAQRFDAAVLLSRSRILAAAAAAAGIPRRHGYGVGTQRLLLNRGPFLPKDALDAHPFDQAGTWLAAAGIPLSDPEPRLHVAVQHRDAARRVLGGTHPIALGIGASDAWKRWSPAAFAALAAGLFARGWPALILVGGATDQADADTILARLSPADSARVTPILGWPLRDVAAFLSECTLYIGNDTAALNIAAAVGTRSFGLFGATPVLHHSSKIHPLVPVTGYNQTTGMAQITPSAVLDALPATSPPFDTFSKAALLNPR